jgi:hypothetical protein
VELALLIALLFCVALFAYALRVTGDRNRLQREVEIWRDGASGFVIAYGSETRQDSPRQRQERAAKILADLQRVSPLGRKASKSNDANPKRRK